jgi:hypothetical protein
MKVLANIIQESEQYYRDIKKKIESQIGSLPKGSVKERALGEQKYYYHQFRKGDKVIHKYLGKDRPDLLFKQVKQRQALQSELKNVKDALKLIKMSKGRKRDQSR